MAGEKPEARLETMLGYALVALSMGYEVLAFFTLDGAMVIKKQVFEKMDKKIKEKIGVQENGWQACCVLIRRADLWH